MAKRYRQVAHYYDAEYADQKMLREDVPFFLGQLPRRRQDVLEVAVGTGRAAIPIALAGHRVVGIDYAGDMLDIARRKRDAAGLDDKRLQLVRADAANLSLGRQFDWVCIFFNTFLTFTTLDRQDRALERMVAHLKPRGRLWIDVFNPDLSLLAETKLGGLEPIAFFVPALGRTVAKTTTLRRTGVQTRHVTAHYTWFDAAGRRRQDRLEYELTFLFPRELQLLVERHGLRIERLWGNYDGSDVTPDSPRLVARCCRT